MIVQRDPVDKELIELFASVHTIAVVGLSDRSDRPSFGVAKYLQRYFNVIPVNPTISQWEGLPCYPGLGDIPSAQTVDLVNIFRRAADVLPVVDAAIARGASGIWMQLGIIQEEAARKAREEDIVVVMDRCIAVEHRRLQPFLP